MLKIRRPLGRLIFNMGIAIPGKTVFLIETAPWAIYLIGCLSRCDLPINYDQEIEQIRASIGSVWVVCHRNIIYNRGTPAHGTELLFGMISGTIIFDGHSDGWLPQTCNRRVARCSIQIICAVANLWSCFYKYSTSYEKLNISMTVVNLFLIDFYFLSFLLISIDTFECYILL